MTHALEVEPNGESGGHCDCCGHETRTIWGYVHKGEQTLASYFVQWTRNAPTHFPNIDFLVGTWGHDNINDKKLISWQYNPASPSFMVIDSTTRPLAKSQLCARALTREDVKSNSSLMASTAELLDAIWLGDPRILEVQELA